MVSIKDNIFEDERHVLQDDTETGVDMKIQACHGQNEIVNSANMVRLGLSLYTEIIFSIITN